MQSSNKKSMATEICSPIELRDDLGSQIGIIDAQLTVAEQLPETLGGTEIINRRVMFERL